jgi:AmmeMemoRadiSam system protein B
MSESLSTLGPAVAGTWYPGDARALGRQLDGFLRDAAEPAGGATLPFALIEPHAGYAYSGPVAAHGFARLRGASCDRVVLIGPSHYAAFRGAVVPRAGAYRTPLGELPFDREALGRLVECPGFGADDGPFAREHSLEMEIPFLQRVLTPGFALVPVLVGGGASGDGAAEIAAGLAGVIDPRTLVVVSSDFTHFGRGFGYVPFEDDLPRRIRELDHGAIATLERADAEAFERYVDETGATICGRGPISVLLRLLPAGTRGELVAYDTSGNQTGDWGHSVSYAALSFPR